ncbi:MAG: hypothetical protein IMZ62_17405 [Chloroflexi bacterium]|nr:hypothetical protein [Chloroflexota bacterium]
MICQHSKDGIIIDGAVVYAVVEEFIPELQSGKDTYFSTFGTMHGFAIMLLLEVALG